VTEAISASIDITDDTFILTSSSLVAEVVRDRDRWRIWWPDRVLTVYSDRGDRGLRWTVAGDFVGSTENWIEESAPGVIVHYYLRVDATREGSSLLKGSITGSPRSNRYLQKVRHREVTTWKRIVWQIKDELEGLRGIT
jgi:hypothetical protein